ncbi:DUF1850 domain-containing protein [Bacillus salipaludis]|uniref:DUF1850 domain-containing protein n=1 Tax=Bacillus salipaludis TaxID=2547811 RepID=UPI003D1ABE42
MKKCKFLKFIMYLVIFLILITIFAAIPLQESLVFQPLHSTAKIAYIPIKDDSRFKIKYTHSIHLTDVIESYKITSDYKIQQYELEYQDFAIGMPSNAGEGERFVQKNGKYYIKNMKRIFPFFNLRIGQVRANHRVIFDQREYPLSLYIKPGSAVKVEFRKLSIIQRWKGVNILESI